MALCRIELKSVRFSSMILGKSKSLFEPVFSLDMGTVILSPS